MRPAPGCDSELPRPSSASTSRSSAHGHPCGSFRRDGGHAAVRRLWHCQSASVLVPAPGHSSRIPRRQRCSRMLLARDGVWPRECARLNILIWIIHAAAASTRPAASATARTTSLNRGSSASRVTCARVTGIASGAAEGPFRDPGPFASAVGGLRSGAARAHRAADLQRTVDAERNEEQHECDALKLANLGANRRDEQTGDRPIDERVPVGEPDYGTRVRHRPCESPALRPQVHQPRGNASAGEVPPVSPSPVARREPLHCR